MVGFQVSVYLDGEKNLRLFSLKSNRNLAFFFSITNAGNKEEEMQSGMKSGNACYLSVQNIVSSSLLFKNIKIKTH